MKEIDSIKIAIEAGKEARKRGHLINESQYGRSNYLDEWVIGWLEQHEEMKLSWRKTAIQTPVVKRKTFSSDINYRKKSWPDPTIDIQEHPLFNSIWEVIKAWDISVPGAYTGYQAASGNHARAIHDKIINDFGDLWQSMKKEVAKVKEPKKKGNKK